MKSLEWPNNNTYINITPHLYLKLTRTTWYLQTTYISNAVARTLRNSQACALSRMGMLIHARRRVCSCFNAVCVTTTGANMWRANLCPLLASWISRSILGSKDLLACRDLMASYDANMWPTDAHASDVTSCLLKWWVMGSTFGTVGRECTVCLISPC